jgi:hypothetical protein
MMMMMTMMMMTAQNHGADFVRACLVETHAKFSQEPF